MTIGTKAELPNSATTAQELLLAGAKITFDSGYWIMGCPRSRLVMLGRGEGTNKDPIATFDIDGDHYMEAAVACMRRHQAKDDVLANAPDDIDISEDGEDNGETGD